MIHICLLVVVSLRVLGWWLKSVSNVVVSLAISLVMTSYATNDRLISDAMYIKRLFLYIRWFPHGMGVVGDIADGRTDICSYMKF